MATASQEIDSCCKWWFKPASAVHWREAFEAALRELLATDTRIVVFDDAAECKAMDRQVQQRLVDLRETVKEKHARVTALMQAYNVACLQQQCRKDAAPPPADRRLVERWIERYAGWLQEKHAAIRREQVGIDGDLADADATLAALTSERHVLAERFAHLADDHVREEAPDPADPDDYNSNNGNNSLVERQTRRRNRALAQLRGSIRTMDVDDEIRNLLSLKNRVDESKRISEEKRQHRDAFDRSLRERRDLVNGTRRQVHEAERAWDEARATASDHAKRYFENDLRCANLRRMEAWHAKLLELDREIDALTAEVASWTQYKETIAWEIPPFEQPFTEATRAVDLVEFARALLRNIDLKVL